VEEYQLVEYVPNYYSTHSLFITYHIIIFEGSIEISTSGLFLKLFM